MSLFVTENDTIQYNMSLLKIMFVSAEGVPKMKQKRKPRSYFTSQEDSQLKQLVEANKRVNWNLIASQLNRTTKQCKDRYNNYLAPGIKSDPWTEEEDIILMKKVKEYGRRWKEIAKYIEGKSPNNIKNRWKNTVSKLSQSTTDIFTSQNQIDSSNKKLKEATNQVSLTEYKLLQKVNDEKVQKEKEIQAFTFSENDDEDFINFDYNTYDFHFSEYYY